MIEFKHVSKTYPNGVKGLKDVNLKFEQGEFVAIIGLSGAGKSTLIRTINRMIDITEGELTVDDTDVSKLSGGQQQRVALARTLNQNPSIILADEPVAALDPVTAHQVMADFKRINEEMNITILINIHHVDLALGYAQRVVGIRAGEIVYDGPASEVTQDILDSIYNGSAVPQAGGN